MDNTKNKSLLLSEKKKKDNNEATPGFTAMLLTTGTIFKSDIALLFYFCPFSFEQNAAIQNKANILNEDRTHKNNNT